MGDMGLQGAAAGPCTSATQEGHKVDSYLLAGVETTRPNQVWVCDITCVPMPRVYLHLTVVMDWFSRHVLAWHLSYSLEVEFSIEAIEEASRQGRPEIFKTDQGSQFTERLRRESIQIRMDGRWRADD